MNTKDERRFVIVITEGGETYTHDASEGILPTAEKLIGGTVTGTACIDKRFRILYDPNSQGRENEFASRLAQEYVAGPAVVACGPQNALQGMSRYGAKDTAKHLYRTMHDGR